MLMKSLLSRQWMCCLTRSILCMGQTEPEVSSCGCSTLERWEIFLSEYSNRGPCSMPCK